MNNSLNSRREQRRAISNVTRLMVLAVVVFAPSAMATAIEPYKSLIVAHRGLVRHAPENTLANFRACLNLRLGFEMDVRRTKDGVLVCIHDTTVDRTTNGTGAVAELNLSEIKRLDAGSWYDSKFKGESAPTIEEVLKLASQYRNHDILIAADLKVDNAEAEMVQLAKKYKLLNKILFIGNTIQDPEVRKRLRQASGEANIAVVAHNPQEVATALAAKNANWVYFRYLPGTREMAAIRKKGKRSFIAGKFVAGNLPDNWSHANGVGIDAILTDYPLNLRELQRFADQ